MNPEQRINYALALDTQRRLKERRMPRADAFVDADPKAYLDNWIRSYKESNFNQTLSHPSPQQSEAFIKSVQYTQSPSRTGRDADRGIEDMKAHPDKPQISR